MEFAGAKIPYGFLRMPMSATYRCGVRAEQIAEEFPVVSMDSDALEAVLPKPPPDMATVKSDDTLVEVAAIMAHNRSPLVAVMGAKGIIGVISAPRLLEVALGSH